MKANVLSGILVVFVFSAAPRSAKAQAATEYGLTAASGASSTSGVAKVFNQKLNADRVPSAANRSSTVVHIARPAGPKVKRTNTKSGQSPPAAGTSGASKQTGTSTQHARETDPFGMTIVGAERR